MDNAANLKPWLASQFLSRDWSPVPCVATLQAGGRVYSHAPVLPLTLLKDARVQRGPHPLCTPACVEHRYPLLNVSPWCLTSGV